MAIPALVEEQPATNTQSPPPDLSSSESRAGVLIATNGRPRRTRYMVDIYACICGKVVEDEARVIGSDTALRCAFEGCETLWFHLECLNFEHAPRGWRCENHVHTRKRQRMA